MPRTARKSPGVDPKLLIKDAARLMPDPTRRLFLRGGASLGALTFLTGCDIVDSLSAERALRQGVAFQRPGAGLAVQPEQAGADLSRQRDHAAVPVQRLLSGGRGARGRRGRLRARGRRPGRQQEDLDARPALRAAAGDPDHPPHLRRGLERDRQMDGRAVLRIPARVGADTRAKYVWFRCAEGYSNIDRHADRAASADADDVPIRRRRSCRASTASR